MPTVYKLFYEKINPSSTETNKMQIAASATGIPSADDKFLTFKADDGSAITYTTLRTTYHFFYEKLKQIIFAGQSKVQLPTNTDIQVNVFVNGELLFGTPFYTISIANDSEGTTTLAIGTTSVSDGGSVAEGQTITGTITNSDSKKTASVTVNDSSTGVTVAADGKSFTFVVKGDSEIKVTEEDV